MVMKYQASPTTWEELDEFICYATLVKARYGLQTEQCY
jgi:hypothetical protein